MYSYGFSVKKKNVSISITSNDSHLIEEEYEKFAVAFLGIDMADIIKAKKALADKKATIKKDVIVEDVIQEVTPLNEEIPENSITEEAAISKTIEEENASAEITQFVRIFTPLRLQIKGLEAGEKIYAVTFATNQTPSPDDGSLNMLVGQFMVNCSDDCTKAKITAVEQSNGNIAFGNAVSAVYDNGLEAEVSVPGSGGQERERRHQDCGQYI